MSRSMINKISCAHREDIDQYPSSLICVFNVDNVDASHKIFAWHDALVMIWLRRGTHRLKEN